MAGNLAWSACETAAAKGGHMLPSGKLNIWLEHDGARFQALAIGFVT